MRKQKIQDKMDRIDQMKNFNNLEVKNKDFKSKNERSLISMNETRNIISRSRRERKEITDVFKESMKEIDVNSRRVGHAGTDQRIGG